MRKEQLYNGTHNLILIVGEEKRRKPPNRLVVLLPTPSTLLVPLCDLLLRTSLFLCDEGQGQQTLGEGDRGKEDEPS